MSIIMDAKIDRAFKYFDSNIKFDPIEHAYTMKNVTCVSVSKLMDSYKVPFDSDAMSIRSSYKRGISVKEILSEWKRKNELSQIRGHRIHRFAECVIMDIPYDMDVMPDRIDMIAVYNALIHMKDTLNLEVVAVEFRMGNPKLGICGTTDLICRNRTTLKYWIMDWKTNLKPSFSLPEKFAKPRLHPISNITDSKLDSYGLQMGCYEMLLGIGFPEIEIEGRGLYHINGKGFEYLPVRSYVNEAGAMMHHYRKSLPSVA